METLLIPRLILPYLDRCVIHATVLNTRAEAYRDMLEGDRVAEMALHNPQLVKGIAASLRTLIIASFRAPSTQFVMTLLRRLNPTSQILRASAFCRYHDYIFALICMLNVNMGALDLARAKDGSSEDGYALEMLGELAQIFYAMDREKQGRVLKRLMYSGALPLSRDTTSYATVMSIVDGAFFFLLHTLLVLLCLMQLTTSMFALADVIISLWADSAAYIAVLLSNHTMFVTDSNRLFEL